MFIACAFGFGVVLVGLGVVGGWFGVVWGWFGVVWGCDCDLGGFAIVVGGLLGFGWLFVGCVDLVCLGGCW